jgi:hypothetical protein
MAEETDIDAAAVGASADTVGASALDSRIRLLSLKGRTPLVVTPMPLDCRACCCCCDCWFPAVGGGGRWCVCACGKSPVASSVRISANRVSSSARAICSTAHAWRRASASGPIRRWNDGGTGWRTNAARDGKMEVGRGKWEVGSGKRGVGSGRWEVGEISR